MTDGRPGGEQENSSLGLNSTRPRVQGRCMEKRRMNKRIERRPAIDRMLQPQPGVARLRVIDTRCGQAALRQDEQERATRTSNHRGTSHAARINSYNRRRQ